ncbi:MAG: hypothetical protein AAB337_00580 [Patescibacteria group bacterium]
MKYASLIFSILFVLIVLSSPFKVFAVDSTGGQCFCTLEKFDGLETSTLVDELGGEYDTSDDTTCQSACAERAYDLTGRNTAGDRYYTYTVTDYSYTYPTDAVQEEIIQKQAEEEARTFLRPNLNVDIPGLSFSNILNKNGKLQISFIPEYLNGLYRYALGAGALIAIVMIMIGGAQYILGSGLGSVEAGRKRITNAVTGLVLLLSAYTLLYLVNPNLTLFKAVEVDLVSQIKADLDTAGPEGSTGGANATLCETAIEEAQSSGSCPISQSLFSPTSTDPIATSSVRCGYHFTEKNVGYDYEKMTRGLDFNGGWGDSLYAPGDGNISFKVGTKEGALDGSRCGNSIVINLTGGGIFSICHVKAFEPSAMKSKTVERGSLIGYVGGECCAGEKRPSSWDSASVTGTCSTGGTKCGSPSGGNTACGCQSVYASGNTTGAHVHGTLTNSNGGGLSLLACLSGESSTEETGESESEEGTTECADDGVCESTE